VACTNPVGGDVLFPPKQVQELRHLLEQAPQQVGVEKSRWQLSLIGRSCSWLKDYSPSGIWRILRALSIHYKRGQQHMHSPDPTYEEKKARAQKCVQAARQHPESVITLYLDEFSYYRWATVAPVYVPAGRKQPLTNLPARYNTRERLVLALNVNTGQVVYRQRAHIDLAQLVAFMSDLRQAYPQAPQLNVIQDNWHHVHFHPDQIAAAERLGITLVPLPTYAPWLNPVEKVGRKWRQEIIHMHRQADDWECLKQRTLDFFDQFAHGSSELLRYVGLSPA
jgi:DDE superfamily endonuclease